MGPYMVIITIHVGGGGYLAASTPGAKKPDPPMYSFPPVAPGSSVEAPCRSLVG